MKLEFEAELKETKQSKSVSLDNVYSVKFTTNNPQILELGMLDANTLFKVTVEVVK